MTRPQTVALFSASEGASTPSPLSRKRSSALSSEAASRSTVLLAHAQQKTKRTSSGLAPTNPIEKNDIAPLSRHDKAIETKESNAASRIAHIARIEGLRVIVGQLLDDIVRNHDNELLDLLCDEHGKHSRYRTAQDARDWAIDARRQLQLGFMMLDRAMNRRSSF